MNLTQINNTETANHLPWLVCFLASLYFFYEIVQLAVFNTIAPDLMQAFALSPLQLGNISASYLYACAFSLLPAGLILDRFSTRYVLTVVCGFSTLGVFLIATAQFVEVVWIGRILAGIGNAFAFLGAMRLASHWFAGRRIALAMGFSVTVGMLGGIVAQAPFLSLADALGWHTAMLINAGVGLVILCALFLGVRDREMLVMHPAQAKSAWDLLKDLKIAASNTQNWLCGVYTGLLNLPEMVLGALWGNAYLMSEKGVQEGEAAHLTSLIFLGLIIGAPLLGWITDKLKNRTRVMMLSAFILCATICTIIVSNFHFLTFCGLFFLMGILSAAQTLSYPIVSEDNPGILMSTCLGLVAVVVNVVAGFSQALFSRFVESGYGVAIFILPAGFGVSLLIAIVLHRRISNRHLSTR